MPTLRSITETASSMHDGAFTTLEEVVQTLDRGRGLHLALSPLMHARSDRR